jgi:hypothetical protein
MDNMIPIATIIDKTHADNLVEIELVTLAARYLTIIGWGFCDKVWWVCYEILFR